LTPHNPSLGALFSDLAGVHAQTPVAGLSADSRKIKPGFVFVALKGAAADGAAFVPQAKANGAIAVLSAPGVDAHGLIHLEAANPRLAFAEAAARFFGRQPRLVAAVTGTNGKTSTVDFLRQIWAHGGAKSGSLGTLGAIWPGGAIDIGLTTGDPVQIHETLARFADDGVTHAAMEASSHGLDQHRLDGVKLGVVAFTNLTQDHLDYHGTMDAYRAAKLRLFDLVGPGAHAVVNADAEAAPDFEARARARGLDLIGCGWRAGAEGLKIVELMPRPNGQVLELSWRGKTFKVELPLIGEFQALNAVTAAAIALGGGASAEAVFAGMAALKPVKGRMEHVGATKEGAHVFVDYAHTPDGLDVLLRAARPHAPGRIILVFGCGGDRDAGKRPKMGAVAARHADIVLVTDDNPRSEDPAAIRAQVLAGAPGAIDAPGRAAAIARGVGLLKPGDALLIAGKGHETGQIVGGTVHPFSDQDEAQKALGGSA
jgi:UDP-N-acetylmuramoyl-L-alanyl-D-glutamate--2,6-diaminopimelate ligase